jgi:hypothetical protein
MGLAGGPVMQMAAAADMIQYFALWMTVKGISHSVYLFVVWKVLVQ